MATTTETTTTKTTTTTSSSGHYNVLQKEPSKSKQSSSSFSSSRPSSYYEVMTPTTISFPDLLSYARRASTFNAGSFTTSNLGYPQDQVVEEQLLHALTTVGLVAVQISAASDSVHSSPPAERFTTTADRDMATFATEYREHRWTALQGLCHCDDDTTTNDSFSSSFSGANNNLVHKVPLSHDPTTTRTSLATSTIGTQTPLTLQSPAKDYVETNCPTLIVGSNSGSNSDSASSTTVLQAMEELRDDVALVTNTFVQAWDRLIGSSSFSSSLSTRNERASTGSSSRDKDQPSTVRGDDGTTFSETTKSSSSPSDWSDDEESFSSFRPPLLRTKQNGLYRTIASIQTAATHLEHFHVYAKQDGDAEEKKKHQHHENDNDNDDNNYKQNQEPPSVPWHTDAGLFLSFVPAVDCSSSSSFETESPSPPVGMRNEDDSSFLVRYNSTIYQVPFPPNSVVIMLGVGAEHWLFEPPPMTTTRTTNQHLQDQPEPQQSHHHHYRMPFRATHHAVQLHPGQRRAWYGMMTMVPDDAITYENPSTQQTTTFADMKRSMSLLSNNNNNDADNQGEPGVGGGISVGCGIGSHPSSLLRHDTNGGSNDRSLDPVHQHVPRRRFLHVQNAQACNNVTNFFCWMSCLDIPTPPPLDASSSSPINDKKMNHPTVSLQDHHDARPVPNEGPPINDDIVNTNDERYNTIGPYSLHCMDPHIYAMSGNQIAPAVEPCQNGMVLNPNCQGKWVKNPAASSTTATTKAPATATTTTKPSVVISHNHNNNNNNNVHLRGEANNQPHLASHTTTTTNVGINATLGGEVSNHGGDSPEKLVATDPGDADPEVHPSIRKQPSLSTLSQQQHGGHDNLESEPFCRGATSMYMNGFSWMEPTCVVFLFPQWILSSRGKFAAACIATILFGSMLEWVIQERRKVLALLNRQVRQQQQQQQQRIHWKQMKEINPSVWSHLSGPKQYSCSTSSWSYFYHSILGMLLYAIQLTMGYFIMLIIMTYNGPLFICSILGLVAGHVMFKPAKKPDAMQLPSPITTTTTNLVKHSSVVPPPQGKAAFLPQDQAAVRKPANSWSSNRFSISRFQDDAGNTDSTTAAGINGDTVTVVSGVISCDDDDPGGDAAAADYFYGANYNESDTERRNHSGSPSSSSSSWVGNHTAATEAVSSVGSSVGVGLNHGRTDTNHINQHYYDRVGEQYNMLEENDMDGVTPCCRTL